MPNTPPADRDAVSTGIIDLLPDWITDIAQLNELIADRMGVAVSDLHGLHALHREGPTTAGALADRIGLNPSSVSRMIDRLDEAGCVSRVPDPHDRRRVLIEPTAGGLARAAEYYASLTARTRDDLASLTTTQLRALRDFLHNAHRNTRAELDRLRADPTS
jgi:DNA-binding MarR family transcriptional regulator